MTRSSRSAAVEELLAAAHKKELGFSFLEEQKRKEVHVRCSLGRAIWQRKEEERGKKQAGRWRGKRYGTPSASLENILHRRHLFTAIWRHPPNCCHISSSSSIRFGSFPQKGNGVFAFQQRRERLFFMCIIYKMTSVATDIKKCINNHRTLHSCP